MATNTESLEVTLTALTDAGRIVNVDQALVQALRSMAGSLDRDPSNAALWRQYRETLKELTADDSDSSVTDGIAALFSGVRHSPPS